MVRLLRRLPLAVLCLALAAGLVGGALAVLGQAGWGDAGWYYHPGPDYRLRYGQQAIRLGRWDRVEQVALVLEGAGHNDQAALLRGEVLYRQGKQYADGEDWPRAVPLLRRAEKEFYKIRDKGDVRLEAAALLGQCYRYLGRPYEAVQALEFVLSERPNHVDSHRGLAILYFDQGAWDRAAVHFKRVAELEPGDGRPQRFLGRMYKEFEKYTQAIAAYEEALRRDLRGQDPAAVHRELAECLARIGRYAEALEILGRLDPLPEDSAVTALRAECLQGQGRTAEAAALLDQTLARHSGSVELCRLRGKLYVQAKEPLAAVPLLHRALELDPNDLSSRYLLAQAYESLGQHAEAAAQDRLWQKSKHDLEELSRLNQEALERPWDGALRRRLAELCQDLGKPQEATMWRQAALACPPPATTAGPKPP